MQKSYRFILSALLLGAFLLSACSGTLPSQDDSAPSPSDSQITEVVFTGTVQSMGGGEWTVSGQAVSVDGSTAIDANIQVGDIVKVEARVAQDGKVFAVRIESSLPDDTNTNDANSNDANSNDNTNTADDNSNANSNDDGNSNSNDNSNTAPSGPEQEFVGTVQAITKDSITINGVTYKLATFTEFKNPIVLGDQVKIHVVVNADGTLTIREIEKTTGTGLSNTNGNSNDDDSNSNGNSNDDNSNDDDDDNNGNGNDDNSNDDDNNSNDNG